MAATTIITRTADGAANTIMAAGRRQRFFGHGELRLVILDILTRNASHGYELIKAIETDSGQLHPQSGRDLSDARFFAGSAIHHPHGRGERA
jgi:hypothetical protein